MNALTVARPLHVYLFKNVNHIGIWGTSGKIIVRVVLIQLSQPLSEVFTTTGISLLPCTHSKSFVKNIQIDGMIGYMW